VAIQPDRLKDGLALLDQIKALNEHAIEGPEWPPKNTSEPR
jgi:hypothetical protein